MSELRHNQYDQFFSIQEAGYGEKPIFTLRDFKLPIISGEIILLRGTNGSGKSTVLGIVAGLHELRGGWAISEWSQANMARVAYVPQNPYEFFLFSAPAADFASLQKSFLLPPNRGEALLSERLREAGLCEYLHEPVSSLSEGEKRIMALAIATSASPDLLLLDEPFMSLSKTNVHMVQKWISESVRSGAACILACHSEIGIWSTSLIEVELPEPKSLINIDAVNTINANLTSNYDAPSVSASEMQIRSHRNIMMRVPWRRSVPAFSVEPGQVALIIGENGSGKTALVRTIGGTRRPLKGGVSFSGKVVSTRFMFNFGRQSTLRRFCYQIPQRRLVERLKFTIAHYLMSSLEEKLSHLLLSAFEHGGVNPSMHFFDQLSAGQQRILEIMVACTSDRSILLADEPFAPLDSIYLELATTLLRKKVNAGGIVIMAEHRSILNWRRDVLISL